MIMRHELLPNTKLSVPALADQFNVSRSPVREAVQRVVRDGLAVQKPRLGAHVTSFEPEALRDLFQMREVLEGLAARLAAENHNEDQLEAIRSNCDKHKKLRNTGTVQDYIEADIALHDSILATCGNIQLQETLGLLYDRIRIVMSLRVAAAGPDKAVADHRVIVERIAARDADGAEAAARAHIARALAGLAQN